MSCKGERVLCPRPAHAVIAPGGEKSTRPACVPEGIIVRA
jgi:hypothetical protein